MLNANKKILRTAYNYIEGWYEGNTEKMVTALHPNMKKRFFENNIMHELDFQTMIDYTKNGGGKNVSKDLYKIEVKILDVYNDVATVMVKSEYIDYLHLIKINELWLIINVLWTYNKN